ncbi:MAG: tetratricopeptide repeat protein [Flavobacteriales bacterium]|nr:tetratricopeptide repeat protein [Flavobacteriales bacterium]
MALDSLRPDDFGSDPFLAFQWHFGRAEVLHDREFFDEARAATAKALLIAEANGMEREQCGGCHLSRKIDLRDAQYERALGEFHKGFVRANELSDARSACQALVGIGSVHYFQSNTKEAIMYYQRALDLARAAGERRVAMITIYNLAAASGYAEGEQAAIAIYRNLLDTASSMDNEFRADVLINMADAYRRLDDPRTALELIDQAIALYPETGDRTSRAKAHQFRATACWNLGRKEEALEEIKTALSFTRSPDLRTRLILRQAKYLNELGRFEEAYERINAYRLGQDTLLREKFNEGIALAKVRFETAEKEHRLLEQEQALLLAEEAQRRRAIQRNAFIGIAAVLLLVALLLYRSMRTGIVSLRRERELHSQQVDQLLAQQELKSINAMLEGWRTNATDGQGPARPPRQHARRHQGQYERLGGQS